MGIRHSYEHEHQVALFNWRELFVHAYPALKLLRGSMNGVHLSKAQAAKAKAAGMLTGEHDVTLPVPRGGYTGLSVELKYGNNKPTQAQIDYGNALIAEGWLVAYFWDWVDAAELIKKYLEGRLVADER